MATEPLAAEALCDHAWGYNKPAPATVSVRICSLCHTIDGEDLMRTLNEHAREQLATLKQKRTTLLYAHSDGETHSYVDQPGGIPDTRRERAVLRGILQHTLTAVAEREYGAQAVTLHSASD
ncbi:hypothetical protein OHR86_28240 [Streptomyces sp. NBC_00441]|uniref:hypothetical protein n=1 Tax=Streptomyces sp. NBC_00441 TaxID=2975742 RepID=UPI002E2CA091|nr:hypothetical protein [Streptomyces sp. NBC_00441]